MLIQVPNQGKVNPERLHEELKVALGESFGGISVDDRGEGQETFVEVYVEGVAEEDILRLIERHNPDLKSGAQEQREEEAAKLEALREAYPEPIDPTAYKGADPLLKELIGRIERLERAILNSGMIELPPTRFEGERK